MKVMRRGILFLFPAILLSAQSGGAGNAVSNEEVLRVHRSALLIDTHNDVPYYIVQGRDIASPGASPHTTLAELKSGGVGGLFFSVWVAKEYVQENRSANRALQLINSVRRDMVEKHPADFMLSGSVKEIEEAHRQGKIAALMGIEGGHAIEDSLRILRRLLRPRRPLHDPHPHQHQQLGRFLRRHHPHRCQASQRPHSFRQGRGAGDEPDRA